MRKPYILFQTDFGVWGGASMYGMCKIVDPTLQSGELSHTVPTFDVVEASRRLALTLPFWPEGTVFVSVVDPGVGTPRRACVARTVNGYYIVTPDNGTLADTRRLYGIREIREIDENVNRYPHTPKVSIFHGRDLFAYCAARLAAGVIDYTGVGPAYALEDIVDGPALNMTGPKTERYAEANTQTESYKKAAARLTAAYAQYNPGAVVVINDFNHSGGLAILRGISKCYRFDMAVYDMPVSTADMTDAERIAAEVRPYWPEGTLFVAADADQAAVCDKPFVRVI